MVPRLVMGIDGWDDTAVDLPPGQWHNELTAEQWPEGRVRLSDLLARFPVALLCGGEEG